MWTIKSVEIDNFWGKYKTSTKLNSDVTILIGDNGSGKTTYMNLLNAALSVDIYSLSESEFGTIKIKIQDSNNKKIKTITIYKNVGKEQIEYKLGNAILSTIPILFRHENNRAFILSSRRIAVQTISNAKKELEKYISLSSLSVYRNPNVRLEHNERDKFNENENITSPVEARLNKLIDRLSKYQLELSMRGEEISADFQNRLLESFLIGSNTYVQNKPKLKLEAFENTTQEISYKDKRIEELKTAYTELKCPNARFEGHVDKYIDACKTIQTATKQNQFDHDNFMQSIQIIESNMTVDKIVDFGKSAKERKDTLFQPLETLLKKIHEFISNKKFDLSSKTGAIEVKNEFDEPIELSKLSSGEKQLLILLIETTLQRNTPTFFLADEPELSLHISWQQKIISAVLDLNSNAQILVATHSPEIAGQFPDNIIDMQEVIHG